MRTLILACALLVVGCGGDSPTSPSPTPQPVPAPAPPPTPFQGAWNGIWVRASCSETGGATGVGCSSFPTTGGLNLTLTQSGSTAQGAVSIGVVQMNASGPISPNQELTLTGQAHQGGATFTIISWRTALNGPVMQGSFVFAVVPDDARIGTVTVGANLQGVVKQ